MKHQKRSIKAVILDMDGVITKTVRLHANAWKQMFDEFLRNRQGKNFQPLDIETDYQQYLDGMPRFDGVRNFLKSRNIELPEGNSNDDSDDDTVYGLGLRKNKLFLNILEKEGVQVFPDTLEMLKKWKGEGIKLGVISSSRNCRQIIESAGLTEYFDVRVDGTTSEIENLKGKPEPDIFLRASELLEVEVGQAIVIEDAIAGVQAGKKGEFALVVGVARNGDEAVLAKEGADVVVMELTELEKIMSDLNQQSKTNDLSDAIDSFDDLYEKLSSRQPVLFLDYDGTLTPIVPNPDEALLSERAKQVLSNLSELITVSIISGRDRQDVKEKAGLDSLIYAGSHGFDIAGPNSLQMQYEEGQAVIPELDEAEKHLQKKLGPVEGAQVERKKYAIAIHFRNVADQRISEIETAVDDELKLHEHLKVGRGKKILELKPALNWDKGKALNWLMDELKLDADGYCPVFIGDDITDEDALKAIEDDGIGIMVGDHGQKTAASYQLSDPDAVTRFLELFLKRLTENKS